jgi:hypothetical protein
MGHEELTLLALSMSLGIDVRDNQPIKDLLLSLLKYGHFVTIKKRLALHLTAKTLQGGGAEPYISNSLYELPELN